jgi:hypothetical protein
MAAGCCTWPTLPPALHPNRTAPLANHTHMQALSSLTGLRRLALRQLGHPPAAAPGSAAAAARLGLLCALPSLQHLALPGSAWLSNEQLAAVARCSALTCLELQVGDHCFPGVGRVWRAGSCDFDWRQL